MKRHLVALLLTLVATQLIDWPSYCKGKCQGRWQDGFYIDGRCFCGDYEDINLTGAIAPPRMLRKDPTPPAVYYGADEMQYAPKDAPAPEFLINF
jgi:hypothetical protein